MFEFLKSFDSSPRKTVVSTHISPEGACNLKCPYCSVTYRDTHSRIELPRIKKYVEDLMERGLKAVILTGGGEPTLYPQFNELVIWLKKEKNLKVALITNGTTSNKISDDALKCFSWVRVSINVFPGWENKISLNYKSLDDECVVGCSMVYTSEHEAQKDIENISRIDLLQKVSNVADKCGAKYIRLLPNCLLEQEQLIEQHVSLQKTLESIGDKRFFQQYKVHGAPKCNSCHQSYFRPYLSEEPSQLDGKPGTVYPCDSVVLNDTLTHFAKKYQLCKPEQILDYIDGKIQQNFNPQIDCSGCVFTDNVNMLEDWKNQTINKFEEFSCPITHEEFV
jgi:organic radical activating enzyme